MRKVILVLLSIVFLIIDNTVMPFFSINTYYPSILMVFAICYSIINDKWDALSIGVISGLLQDIYFFRGFGVNALVNMIICLIASQIGENIFKEKKLIPVVAAFFLTTLKYLMVYVILYVTKVQTHIKGVFYIGITSMILALLMYKRVYKLSQKNYMKKDWKFNE
ncbi:rod shape-determining protein MreD [Clostridium polynesiense]|uniref:rod shape-determining protein MreD n=1 Tax=Clostridium polynesiense TaxID=1325933 RepID=UPI00058B8B64|nr:rod shape-determining protein MreD [Clostridium polynesiense]